MLIDSALELAKVAKPVNNSLFGIELVAASVGGDAPEGAEIGVNTQAMFLLLPRLVTFRVRHQIEVDEVFTAAKIDVATDFLLPQDYQIEKDAFLEFANSVAAANLHTYAQTLLNGLLVEMRLQPRLLPVRDSSDTPLFGGSKLPKVLSAEIMERLRENPDLALE